MRSRSFTSRAPCATRRTERSSWTCFAYCTSPNFQVETNKDWGIVKANQMRNSIVSCSSKISRDMSITQCMYGGKLGTALCHGYSGSFKLSDWWVPKLTIHLARVFASFIQQLIGTGWISALRNYPPLLLCTVQQYMDELLDKQAS